MGYWSSNNKQIGYNSKMSRPRCVYINNRWCQSITQQYLKICLIKDANKYMYMFRPIAAIIKFSSESW